MSRIGSQTAKNNPLTNHFRPPVGRDDLNIEYRTEHAFAVQCWRVTDCILPNELPTYAKQN